jgi:quercetin 2,3-dioxygenase
MITLRPAEERGHANYGWLDTHHTFSFNTYFDPRHMGFRALRVINDDTIQPDSGFGKHPHKDLEIVTYVLNGALTHQDSTGGGGVLRRGDVQHMSAGTGVRHSEFNASKSDAVRLLQIWLLPKRDGLPPRYEQKTFDDGEKLNRLRILASPDGQEGSLIIGQDAKVYASLLDAGRSLEYLPSPGRNAWVQVAEGEIEVNGVTLKSGDGAAISGESNLKVQGRQGRSEFLLFDLA